MTDKSHQLAARARRHVPAPNRRAGRVRMAQWLLACAFTALSVPVIAQSSRPPIIDVHVHAFQPDRFGPPGQFLCQPIDEWVARDPADPIAVLIEGWSGDPDCKERIQAPTTAEEIRDQTFAAMDQFNIVLAVVSGDAADVQNWKEQAPDEVLMGFHFGRTGPNDLPSLDELRQLHAEGRLDVLGELAAQNGGMAPDDPALEPYFALAEELDVPVKMHLGLHAPGTAYYASTGYRAANGNPLGLEDVLVRHPRLRIYICHAAYPFMDNLIALMQTHPQVYVDTSAIDHVMPQKEFHNYLQRLVEAGFGRRIMYGSDQMIWPGAIANAVGNIDGAEFLTEEQRRDIFFYNAVRFFRLDAAQLESR